MSTPSFLPEYAEPGPALVIAGMLVGVRTHESVGETNSRQCSTLEHQASTDARARQPKQRYTRSLAQRLRQLAHG